MTHKDESQFLDFLLSHGSVGILEYILHSENMSISNRLPPLGNPGWFHVWLWDMENSPPPIIRYIDMHKYFTIDRFASEVIGFLRCIEDTRISSLTRGKIYAEIAGWDMNNPAIKINKSKAFINLFNKISRWLQRHAIKDRSGSLLLSGAQEFVKSGGKLIQVSFSDNIKTF